jgi:hypothetical protein
MADTLDLDGLKVTKNVYLEGPDNYREWLRSIENTLIEKDLDDVVEGNELRPTPIAANANALLAWTKKDKKAFGIINSSLSALVHNNLPSTLSSWSVLAQQDELTRALPPNTPLGVKTDASRAASLRLMRHLTTTYSASRGSRRAELLAIIWQSHLAEGDDPTVHTSKLKSAFTAISTATGSGMNDQDFCFALLMSLPPSYNTLVQTYYLAPFLESQSIIDAIRAEYRRRVVDEQRGTANALITSTPFKRRGPTRNTNSRPLNGQVARPPLGQIAPHGAKWCHIHQTSAHDLKECRTAIDMFSSKANMASTYKSGAPAEPVYTDAGEANFTASPTSVHLHASAAASALLARNVRHSLDAYHIDSGATEHMDSNELRFINKFADRRPIIVGGGKVLWSTHVGKVRLSNQLTLDKVLLIPDLRCNLISVARLLEAGCKVNFQPTEATIQQHGTVIGRAPRSNGLYTLQASYHPTVGSAHLAIEADQLTYWHRRLCHLNFREVVRMGSEGLLGEGWKDVPSTELAYAQCEHCVLGKGHRLPSHVVTERSITPNELVHVDIWGPARTASLGQSRYFLTCYDDHTKHVCIYLMKNKSDALRYFKDYIALVQNHCKTTIKRIRSDNGAEFTSHAFQQLLANNGIASNQVPPGAHGQNGRVERAHLTILNAVRTLLIDSLLPPTFWAEAAAYSVYIRNRVPDAQTRRIPYHTWSGKPVSHEHIRPFGSAIYIRDHVQTNKLAPRYRKALLMGWAENSESTIRYYDIEKRTFGYSRDVVFKRPDSQEKQFPATTISRPVQTEAIVNVLEPPQDTSDVPTPEIGQPSPATSAARSTSSSLSPADPDATLDYDYSQDQSVESQATLSDDDDNASNSSGSTDPLNLSAIALLADTSNPGSYREARTSGQWEQWKTAMDDELLKMEKYQVFEVLPRKPGMHILKARWVYTRKIDGTTGKVSAYKARWVAKGYAQIEGIHFNDIHASVVHKDSIRVFLSLVNSLDMECDQVDIKAAFLNGELEETIYLEPPEGSDIPSSHIIRLRKSLYGLRQSPRCFNQAFDKWMQEDGFQPTRADPCLYMRRKHSHTIMVSVHVDDQLIASDSRQELDAFKKRLNARFECTDNGPVNYFLGFNVIRDRTQRRLIISQEHYVEALLERFDMSSSNPVRTPLPASFMPKIATDQEFSDAKHLEFPKLAGSILYLSTITRPDIAYAAGVLARYISRWSIEHYKAAKHLLRYLRGTSDLCLSYDHEAGKRTLLGYADADWGGCQDTRRSTTGYLFKTFGGITSWRARRQPTVSLSTAEAEYMASADAAKQASWLRLLLTDLGYPQSEPTLLYNDNMGAILLSQNPVHHDRSKHISLRHHYLREQVGDKSLSLHHISSKDNQADLFTKNLSADLFNSLRTAIGMRQQPLNTI